MPKKASDTGANAAASDPVTDEPGKENAPATPQSADQPKAKTRLYRGRECEITRTTRNVKTGAIYDLIQYPRRVTNRRDGSISTEFLGLRLRRPGTGLEKPVREVEIETEVEV